MVDRQSKDSYYQQQLAQAAWFSRAGYPGSAHNFPAGGSAGMSGHSGTNHYENYMQQLQQFASAQAAQTAADRQSMFSGSSNPFLGNNSKDISPATFSSPFNFPPGHPMHFPGISNYHRPLPAHSPLPAHMKNNPSSSTSPLPSQLPAHIRSNPYQQTTNYHNLNSPYAALNPGAMNPSYGMTGQGSSPYGSSRDAQVAQERSRQFQETQRQFSKTQSAPQSRASSQDPAQRPGMLTIVQGCRQKKTFLGESNPI